MGEPILVPFHQRPELLYLTLESLSRCTGLDRYTVHLSTYTGYNPGALHVAQYYLDEVLPDGRLHVADERRDLSRNILQSVKTLMPQVSRYLILIEEDVRVTPDALDFLDQAWTQFGDDDVFSAQAFVRETEEGPPGTEDVVERRRWYHPWAVLLPTPTLELIEPHVTEAYFRNRAVYVDRVYPGARLLKAPTLQMGAMNEQAGLLQRLRAKHKPWVLWPKRSRAQHTGYWGGPAARWQPCPHEGTFEERLAAVRQVMASHDEYIRRRWRSWNDYAPLREEGYTWQSLRLSETVRTRT